MAITSETSSIRYSGNDSDSTPYAVPFRFLSNAHLSVVVVDDDGVEEELDLGADFTATGAGTDGDGEIVTAIAYDDTHEVIITRAVPVLQPSVYTEGGPLRMKSIEGSLDYLGMILQGVKSAFRAGRRSLGFPISEPEAHSTDLPTAKERKGKWIKFDDVTGELDLVSREVMATIFEASLPTLYSATAPVNGTTVALDGQLVGVGTAPNLTWYVCKVVDEETTFVPVVPDVLEPEVLKLVDFEDSTPPLKALGLSGGRLSLGDGATVGGNPLTPRRVAGMEVYDLNGTNKTSARFAVVGIPLTAAEVVRDAVIQISGSIKILFDDGFYVSEDPVISMNIGFTHNAYKNDANTKWLKYNSLPTGTEIVYIIDHHLAGDFRLSLNATPGPNKVVISYSNPKIVSDRWGGSVGSTFIRNSAITFFVEPTDTSVAVSEDTADTLWLCVEIKMGDSGTNGDINFAVVYDLDTDVTIP